jgi:hypothetical protein
VGQQIDCYHREFDREYGVCQAPRFPVWEETRKELVGRAKVGVDELLEIDRFHLRQAVLTKRSERFLHHTRAGDLRDETDRSNIYLVGTE